MRVNLEGLAPDPILRLRILAPDGSLMVGANSSIWGVGLGSGHRAVEVSFERLGLRPGCYLGTIGLWPPDGIAEAYEAPFSYYELLIGEDAEPPRLPSRIDLAPQEATDSGEGQLITRAPEPGPHDSTAELVLGLRLSNGDRLAGWVETLTGEVAARGYTPRFVCRGGTPLAWHLFVDLAPGDYTLCCAPWSDTRKEPTDPVHRFPLEIRHPGASGETDLDR
jgi:hypothetical protein